MVGKSCVFLVDVALEVPRSEIVAMIAESVAHAATRKSEVMFDAEHFFDGYKANPAYAMECIQAAYRAGAGWVVLCDTNGGTLPGAVARIVANVCARIPRLRLGIQSPNDPDNPVATPLAPTPAGPCPAHAPV